ESHEFRDGNLRAAVAAYRELSSSTDESVRAEALMRLARGIRKQQQIDDALDAYAKLAGLGAAPVAGSPAELIARRERIVLLNAAGRNADAGNERALLESALAHGKYRIDQATFEYFSDVLPKGAPVSPMTVAVGALWTAWH